MWAMADASNGYIYDFNVYTGATEGRETGLGKKNHQVLRQLFTAISLLTKLLSQQTCMWHHQDE